MESTDRDKVPSPIVSSGLQNGEHRYEGTQCGAPPDTSTEPVDISQMPSQNMTPERNLETPASHNEHASSTKSKKSVRKGKKSHAMQASSRYPLRSSSRPQTSIDQKSTPPVPQPSENIVRERKKKKRRKLKKDHSDEYLSIRNRVRYLLGKMNYEQSLIEAYAGEGWNGQSSEKVRPEKEIERAKSAIISFKLKIRDQFQQLDSLISQGRHEEALFDTEGQIDSEDIFCAKCGSKDLSANNDIILCDGICDRGFHQKCLNPPLLSDDIPSDDEGWLCPGCDCKVDCIDLLNEILGTDLEIEDAWEKVFPEVASAAARNNMYDDYLGLPSEDSEDEDFAPDDTENSEQDADESSSEESGYTSAESGIPANVLPNESLGLPSDDSEDEDFDPHKPESDAESFNDGSGANDSDFTFDSDSEDLGSLNLISDAEKPLPPPIMDDSQFTLQSGNGSSAKQPKKSSLKSELHFLMADAGLDGTVLVSGKRERECLDYKKLHDETYGDNSSDSSDDENWTACTGKKMKNTTNVKVSSSRRCTTTAKGNAKCNKHTFLEKELSQKPQHTSEENEFPRRNKKQILAEELGLSPQQVDRWFSNTGPNGHTPVASQSGSRSKKQMPTSISPKDPVSGKGAVSRKASRNKVKEVLQNFPASMEISVVTAAVEGEHSAAPSKGKKKKNTASVEGEHSATPNKGRKKKTASVEGERSAAPNKGKKKKNKTAVEGDQSATPKKGKKKKNTAASDKSTEVVMNPELVAVHSGFDGSSKMVDKHAASPTTDRQKLVRKELRRTRRK